MHSHMLAHYQTNESLDAIVAGLTPTADDTILAICGSGDQPLALIESGATVYAIDINPEQIAFLQRRVAALQRGAYFSNFFDGTETNNQPGGEPFMRRLFAGKEYSLNHNENYFAKEGRLAKITEHLDHLIILEPQDAFRYLQNSSPDQFSQVYLSNALPFFASEMDAQEALSAFADHSHALKEHGRVYMTDGYRVVTMIQYMLPQARRKWDSQFTYDEEHSVAAVKKEKWVDSCWDWEPIVFEKKKQQ